MRSKLMIGAAALSILALTACGGPAGTTSTGAPEETGGASGANGEHPYGLEVAEAPEFEEGTTMAEVASWWPKRLAR